MSIYFPPTQNSIQKTLDAQLLSGVTASMTLNNVVGIANKPGVCVVDFVDTNNVETPTKREYIAFTGVSGNTLTGLTRNADGGGSDQDHVVGAIVQFPPDILQQKAIIDTFTVEHGQDGKHTKVNGNTVTAGTDTVALLTASQTLTNKTLTSPKINEDVALTATATQLNNLNLGSNNGWISANETWTYVSADDPTFTFKIAGVDLTTKYSAGMRIKLTQTTVKYFIITAVAFSTDTTITVYGGTDYNLDDAAISLNYYSTQKAPQGFPIDPAKWSVVTTSTSDSYTISPTAGTWTNTGTISIAIPIGVWRVAYSITPYNERATAGYAGTKVTLSTANNSQSDAAFTCITRANNTTGTIQTVTKELQLNLSTKATYYINITATDSGQAVIGLAATIGGSHVVRAISSYL